jgi:small subunit ribosomal protein S8
MVTDPIADMLTRIRNAIMQRDRVVVIPASTLKTEVARVLKDEGFIDSYTLVQSKQSPQAALRIRLRYDQNRASVITALKRVSRPGRRTYVNRREIPWVLSGLGVAILSTPKGVMTGQQARKLGVGGEVLCYIW